MAQYMELKSINTTSKQSELAKKLGMSSSIPQRYRHEITMLSPYRNPLNTNKKRSQMINPEDLNWPQKNCLQTLNWLGLTHLRKANWRWIFKQKSWNWWYIFRWNYKKRIIWTVWMELAMQIIHNDKTVGSNTVDDLKDFNSQVLAT